MNKSILELLKKYNPQNLRDYENAMKEILQEITLLGLWRGKFFEHSAFYGGTCLRIFHGLNRFSEDLDFSLKKPIIGFKLNKYFTYVKREISSFGFEIDVMEKEKKSETNILSAFIKGQTEKNLLQITIPEGYRDKVPSGSKFKIKFEIDINPPKDFLLETNFVLKPFSFPVLCYSKPSLFAGKLHALVYRKWKERVKGRDWYDFVWYIANDIPVSLKHLKQRMISSNDLERKSKLGKNELEKILLNRIDEVNFTIAKKDIAPFISDSSELEVWSKDFFKMLVKQKLKVVDEG